MAVSFCGLSLAHPIVNASGTFDAIAARRAFGDALLERFPFAAFVSKTVTLAPRQGNPPPRLWELGAGMINSIGLPNKGLEGYLAHDLPELAAAARAADRERHGLLGRGRRDARARVRRARRGRGARAQRLLPEREDRPDDGRRPGGDRGAARRGPPVHGEAGDREADAELHVAGRGGGRRGGARRRRRLAHQHGPRAWRWTRGGRASRGSAAAPAASPVRRSARWRSRRCARCGPASRIPIVGMGGVQSRWSRSRPARRRRGPGRGGHGVVPRSAAPGRGSPKSSQRAAILLAHRNTRARA